MQDNEFLAKVRACVLDVGEFLISPKPWGCDDADAKSKQMQALFPWHALGSNVFLHPASCGATLYGATSYQAPQPSPCIFNLPTAIPPSFSLIQKFDPSCRKIASIQGKESRASSVPLVLPDDTDGSTFILTLRPPSSPAAIPFLARILRGEEAYANKLIGRGKSDRKGEIPPTCLMRNT